MEKTLNRIKPKRAMYNITFHIETVFIWILFSVLFTGLMKWIGLFTLSYGYLFVALCGCVGTILILNILKDYFE